MMCKRFGTGKAGKALRFDYQRGFGGKRLQDAGVSPVAGIKSLVGEQHYDIAQMLVELAGQMHRVRHLQAMPAEQFHQHAHEHTFAHPLWSAQHDHDLTGLPGRCNIRAMRL